MSAVDPGVVFSFPTSAFPPLAVGFFGLGTGYLIYGLQELVGFPRRSELVDHATGIWGIWMPGFMQFLAGTYLFLGLAIFHSFSAPPLYMAALAFTAYGVQWFALGGIRRRSLDARANLGMTIAFLLVSILGIVVFFHAADHPVGGVFIGLTCVYTAEFFASLGPSAPRLSKPAERGPGHRPSGHWFVPDVPHVGGGPQLHLRLHPARMNARRLAQCAAGRGRESRACQRGGSDD